MRLEEGGPVGAGAPREASSTPALPDASGVALRRSGLRLRAFQAEGLPRWHSGKEFAC